MIDIKGFDWYIKYIAELASTTGITNSSLEVNSSGGSRRIFTIHTELTGTHLVIDASIAPLVIAVITLLANTAIPLICVRVSRSLAVAWSIRRRTATFDTAPRWTHMPVLLSNAGQWLGDFWSGITLCARSCKAKKWMPALRYGSFGFLCLIAIVTGPLTALLVSRETISGFGGVRQGPYFPQVNFTANATNYVPLNLDDHGRAIELLPWTGSFDFPWNNSMYTTGLTVQHPISGVNYKRLDGCLLNDTVLCNSAYPHTHKVSVELPSSRFGLWFAKPWSVTFEAHCLRLNSTSLSGYSIYDGYYYYSLEWVTDASTLPSCNETSDPDEYVYTVMGQGDIEMFDRRKNVITDSWFVDQPSARGRPCVRWPESLRALKSDAIVVLTVYPSRQAVAQVPDDELFLHPQNVSDSMELHPKDIAHILCWERGPFVTIKGHNVSNDDVFHFQDELRRNSLPQGLFPLLQATTGEFMIKPVRYLRDATLLQSISEVPSGEYLSIYAPPVPFGVEMHRWAHVGTLDILSKPTRMSTGYYSRGTNPNATVLSEAITPELIQLSRAVRVVKSGNVSLPLWTILLLVIFMALGLTWTLIEMLITQIASESSKNFVQGFLILAATMPTSLSANVKMAEAAAEDSTILAKVKHSASGWPDVDDLGHQELRPIWYETGNGLILRWTTGMGSSKPSAEKERLILSIPPLEFEHDTQTSPAMATHDHHIESDVESVASS
jgi:hypothetical protein